MGGGRLFLHLDDFRNDGIPAAMALDGVKIGVSDGLAEHGGFLLGLGDGPPAPGCEHPLGTVQKVLLPGDRKPPRHAGWTRGVSAKAVGGQLPRNAVR